MQLLVHIVKLINRSSETDVPRSSSRFVHTEGEPLNELADSLAGEAEEFDPAHSIALDQDPEAVHFCLGMTWVE
jgi:hypothetical protein